MSDWRKGKRNILREGFSINKLLIEKLLSPNNNEAHIFSCFLYGSQNCIFSLIPKETLQDNCQMKIIRIIYTKEWVSYETEIH